MIVPSVDIMNGHAVQLIEGKELALDLGDPLELANRLSVVGEIAVIDLDAAMGKGSNKELIKTIVKKFQCRVGGGIRNKDIATEWLDSGAEKIIIGTAAEPQLLSELPKERVIVALDSFNNVIVVNGWQKKTEDLLHNKIKELSQFVCGFLITFVEIEGKLSGIDLSRASNIVKIACNTKVTFAGGITTAKEVASLDSLGSDAQVGMALHTGHMDLGEVISAILKSDRPDGLFPTIVADEYGKALGLVYSNSKSITESINKRQGIYFSRKRGLWTKGESSGATQELVKILIDCDHDTLLFVVKQNGLGFCHSGTRSCFGKDFGISRLDRRIFEKMTDGNTESYTNRLCSEDGLLESKIVEESNELVATDANVLEEAADLLYFTLVKIRKSGYCLRDVESVLDKRELKISRRPGNAKGK